MAESITEHLLEHARRSPLLGKLRDYGAALANMYLIVLVRRGDEVVEVDLAGSSTRLPEFCRVIRECDEGRRRCTTCRSLVAFSACYRGLTEYKCHGGVSVLAAPVRRSEAGMANCVVVSSCAFAQGSPSTGWRRAKNHADGLPVDLGRLRKAYQGLPRIEADRVPLVSAFVDLAATALSEVDHLLSVDSQGMGVDVPVDPSTSDAVDDLAALLRLSQTAADETGNGSCGASLADLVKAMIERDPSMPFTVGKIAAAARLSPNHLSTLFHQQTGTTFIEYLTEQRLVLAKRLLRDLTLSVKEVARRAGFSDPAYFTRRFKATTGQTPTQWRASA